MQDYFDFLGTRYPLHASKWTEIKISVAEHGWGFSDLRACTNEHWKTMTRQTTVLECPSSRIVELLKSVRTGSDPEIANRYEPGIIPVGVQYSLRILFQCGMNGHSTYKLGLGVASVFHSMTFLPLNVSSWADDELPPPRGVRWELSEKQSGCL